MRQWGQEPKGAGGINISSVVTGQYQSLRVIMLGSGKARYYNIRKRGKYR